MTTAMMVDQFTYSQVMIAFSILVTKTLQSTGVVLAPLLCISGVCYTIWCTLGVANISHHDSENPAIDTKEEDARKPKSRYKG